MKKYLSIKAHFLPTGLSISSSQKFRQMPNNFCHQSWLSSLWIKKLSNCISWNMSIFLGLHLLCGEDYLSSDLDEVYDRVLCSGTQNWNMIFNLTHSDCIWQINVKEALNKLGSSSEFSSSTELWYNVFLCSVPRRWEKMAGNIIWCS